MAGTQHTKEYRALMTALVDLRGKRGLSQTDLATRLARNRSYIAKVELSERRLDIIEFCVWLRALETDPAEFVRSHLSDLPSEIPDGDIR